MQSEFDELGERAQADLAQKAQKRAQTKKEVAAGAAGPLLARGQRAHVYAHSQLLHVLRVPPLRALQRERLLQPGPRLGDMVRPEAGARPARGGGVVEHR